MDSERLDRGCEKGILGLILALLVYGPLALGAVRMVDMLVLQTLTLGVLALWMVRFWINPEHRLLWPPVCWPVLFFAGYAVIRYQQADIEYVARAELIRVLIYAFIFFAVLNNLNRSEAPQIVAFTLMAVALAVSIYAAYQFVTKSNFVWNVLRPEVYAQRGSGTFICPNHLAGFLEMVLPLGLAYVLAGRLGASPKILLGYASLVILAGIGVSNSRGGWAATTVALVVFFTVLLWRRSARLPVVLALLVLLGAGGWLVANNQAMERRVAQAKASGKLYDTRFEIWPATVKMWRDHVWWGVGPGHFDDRFRQYRPDAVQMRPMRAHNDYLNTLADWGVAGAALIAAAWGLFYFGVWRIWKYVQRSSNELAATHSNRAAFVLGAPIGLFALLVHGLTDFNFQIPGNALVAVVLMALVSAHWRFATERFWVTPRLAGRTLATVLLGLGITYLGQQTMVRAREYAFLEQAEKFSAGSSAQVDVLKQAHDVEPQNPETVYRIGEALRVRSFLGNDDFEPLARAAMRWFREGICLNPWDPYAPMRLGMCLDWLDQSAEAWPWFQRANELDPNGSFQIAHLGWHFFQVGDYARAKEYFNRSLRLAWDNPVAKNYLELTEQRLREAVTTRKP